MRSWFDFLIARGSEPSTWRGLVWLLAAAGLTLSPEQAAAIMATGAAIAGLIGVFSREHAVAQNTGETGAADAGAQTVALNLRLDTTEVADQLARLLGGQKS